MEKTPKELIKDYVDSQKFSRPRQCRVQNSLLIRYGEDEGMYAITGDYFDSFTAIFGPKECVLDEKSYPLGYFAVEALEMDRSILRRLEDAVARFKPELEVFLAARTASSAAVAQQKLDAVWELLDQLPVYKNFSHFHSGSFGLFHAMREYPDRTDDAVTSGTEFNRALTYWLDRLERLPGTVDDFTRNTFLLLEVYFEKLPSRSPEAYATAYEKYQSEVRAAYDCNEGEIDKDLDSIALDFPVRLGFKAMSTKDGGVALGEEFTFEELASFLYTDLYKGMAAGNIPRRCHNCKHFFLAVGGYDTVYCNRIAPGETKRTCRQVGAHRKEKEKNEKPIHREYFKAYNRLKARKSRGSISTDEWNRQVAMIQDWRDAAVRGEMSDAELKQKLDGV